MIHCTSYLHGKMHKLPFHSSQFVATCAFELVHSDVWGPALTLSVNGFCYYVLFVNHYTRYTWLYLLKHKSDLFSIFFQFKSMVETQFFAKFKPLNLMVVVNSPLLPLSLFLIIMALFIKFLVLTLHDKMALLRGNTDTL